MMMNIDWLRGCATALVTPFAADGAVDEERFRALVARQIAGGVRLLVPCGTTGESATMSEEEDLRVIKLAIEVAKGKGARVIAGTGSNATASAIRYSRAAKEMGADAVLSVAPYYNKPTQDGLYAHFRVIAEAVADVPVVLYNVPGRTSSNITAATTLRLARDVENIVGIKEASGDFTQIMTILRDRPPSFRVMAGDDAIAYPLLTLGADGVVSVISNETPDLMSQMVGAALDGNFAHACALHYKLLPLMTNNFIESSPGPVKAVMAMMNLLEENFRLPLVPIQEQSRARLREIIAELGIIKEQSHATG